MSQDAADKTAPKSPIHLHVDPINMGFIKVLVQDSASGNSPIPGATAFAHPVNDYNNPITGTTDKDGCCTLIVPPDTGYYVAADATYMNATSADGNVYTPKAGQTLNPPPLTLEPVVQPGRGF